MKSIKPKNARLFLAIVYISCSFSLTMAENTHMASKCMHYVPTEMAEPTCCAERDTPPKSFLD